MNMRDEGGESTLDIDSAVEDIGADLGFGPGDDSESDADVQDDADVPEDDEAAADEELAEPEADDEATAAVTPEPATAREAPKSWAKEMHTEWSKLDPKTQDYFQKREDQFHQGLEQYKGAAQYAKSISDVVAPYREVLASQKLQEPQAIASLMRAHVALTTGSQESRRSAFQQLAKNMGYSMDGGVIAPPPPPTQYERDLQDRLDRIDSERAQQSAAEQERISAEVTAQVETFAADPANVHFSDVAHDMRRLINAGVTDLGEAYKAAIWLNEVSRAKEIATLQTQWTADFKKQSRAKFEAASRDVSVNVRAADSQRPPTEPKGKFLSDMSMRTELAKIKNRA
jgi:hypothetical protein